MGRLIRREGTGSVGTIQRSNEADTEELRSGVVVASGNAGRLVTTGGGRTAPQRLKTISQQEAKRQKQIQQARVDLLDQALELHRRKIGPQERELRRERPGKEVRCRVHRGAGQRPA